MSTPKKERMYKLYWLRTECMSDPLTQGYIGITKNNIYHRFGQHCHSKRPVGSTIREIGEDNILISELTRGSYEDMIEEEYRYRPKRFIGWNIAVGGNKPSVLCAACGVYLPKRASGAQCESCNPCRFTKGIKPHNQGKGRKMEIIAPDGTIHYPEVSLHWCQERGLTPQNLHKVCKGQRAHHKGFKARYISG